MWKREPRKHKSPLCRNQGLVAPNRVTKCAVQPIRAGTDWTKDERLLRLSRVTCSSRIVSDGCLYDAAGRTGLCSAHLIQTYTNMLYCFDNQKHRCSAIIIKWQVKLNTSEDIVHMIISATNELIKSPQVVVLSRPRGGQGLNPGFSSSLNTLSHTCSLYGPPFSLSHDCRDAVDTFISTINDVSLYCFFCIKYLLPVLVWFWCNKV